MMGEKMKMFLDELRKEGEKYLAKVECYDGDGVSKSREHVVLLPGKYLHDLDALKHAKEYNEALTKFQLIQEISNLDIFEGFIDSIIVYNSALAARNAGNHELAVQYFEQAAEITYGGSDTYYLLKNEFISLKDSAKALDALERGYALYPDSTLIIFELVNYHLTSGNSEEGMKYLQKAEELASDAQKRMESQPTMPEWSEDELKKFSEERGTGLPEGMEVWTEDDLQELSKKRQGGLDIPEWAPDKGMEECVKCGYALRSGWSKCPICETPVVASVEPETSQQPRPEPDE